MPKPRKAQTLQPLATDLKGVAQLTSLSQSTIERLVREGKFPKQREASPQRAVWLIREIDEWLENRPLANFLPVPPKKTPDSQP